MAVGSERLRSGIADLDELLNGLILGDNIVWVADKPDIVGRLEDALLTEAVGRGQPCFYVTAGTAPDRLRERFHPDVNVLDARARGPLGNPAVLERAILEGAGGSPPGCVVVDGLDRLARRWGGDRAVGFFSQVCPRLFDVGALAYWRAPRRELGSAFLERITRVTQCVLEVSDGHLRVVKAEGRPASAQGRLLRLEVTEGEIRLRDERALGRLGRGLERVRRERNLTQSDLARLLDVSPSAISQAEGGRRGLSLDTVILLSERLGVSLDDLLSTAPESGYVLARRPRAPVPATSPLVDDPQAGLRAYLIRLGPGESGAPDIVHKGPELVLVASGLVQVTIGSDTPVMRSGDAALATRVAVSAWRNLTSEPAMVFWVLGD
ncbi:MAG TPA: XRE family transcriptional regulator [Acidimicrobiales bacterium]|nr:XRE family transcriptional regulator [Acidimicrobiales bacterium]